MTRYVLGCDPGLTTGLARIDLDTRAWELVQVTPGAAPAVLAALGPTGTLVTFAVERFVVGPRAGRSSTPKAGQVTRELVALLSDLARGLGAQVFTAPAAGIKPWATNKRLDAAGVTAAAGWGHARDGARNALFASHHLGLLPDPLSRAWRA